MIKVILTTNFSDSTRNAAKYAVRLFGTENTQYILMNTIIESMTGNDDVLSVEQLSESENEKNINKEIAHLRESFAGQELNIISRSVYGSLVSAINDLADKEGAHYVVIGNRKTFPVDASILRAKTYDMIGKINCPVLAVPEGRGFHPNEGGLVFATDLKVIKKPNHLEPLIQIAKHHSVPVMNIHISGHDHVTSEKEEEAGMQLDRIFSQVDHQMNRLQNEDVLEGIKDFVLSHGNSLLVMLERKNNWFQRLTSQSLTKELSRLAEMPLLILKDY